MAKGKQGLKDTLDASQITYTNEEVGNIPYWQIDDNYGVFSSLYGTELVEKKEMTRSVKDEEGNVIGAEVYYNWQFCKSADDFEHALLTYSRLTERKLFSKLVKCQDFRELVKIRLQIQKTINDSFKLDGLNKETLKACETIQSHQELETKMQEASKLVDKVTSDANNFIEYIKEKQSIVVNRVEPKKHRTPKEKE